MQTFERDLQFARRAQAQPEHEGTEEHLHKAAGEAIATGNHEALHPKSVLHLQRYAGNASVAGALEERSPVLDVVGKGGGQPLDKGVQGDMESRFGHDFSGVRVHTDSQASASAKAVQAHAYTVGNDIVFNNDQYSPGSSDGQRMLAHELTHVVQQRSGPVDGSPAGGGISLSDPSDRFEREAEATADRVMSGDHVGGAQTGGAQGATSAQRQAAPEEEPVQSYAIQRAEGGEEESEGGDIQRLAIQREEGGEEEGEGG